MSRRFEDYDEARREAGVSARATGLDYGIERFREYGQRWVYLVRVLPAPEKSFGCDLRPERVHPTDPPW